MSTQQWKMCSSLRRAMLGAGPATFGAKALISSFCSVGSTGKPPLRLSKPTTPCRAPAPRHQKRNFKWLSLISWAFRRQIATWEYRHVQIWAEDKKIIQFKIFVKKNTNDIIELNFRNRVVEKSFDPPEVKVFGFCVRYPFLLPFRSCKIIVFSWTLHDCELAGSWNSPDWNGMRAR